MVPSGVCSGVSSERFRWKVVLEVDGVVSQTIVEAATVWDAVVEAKGAEAGTPRLLLVTDAQE